MPDSPEPSTGSPLGPASFCAACGAPLAPGGRFCHRCGTPVGQGAPAGRPLAPVPAGGGGLSAVLPWGVAFVALLALVAMMAGRNFGAPRGSVVDGSANALPTQAIDGPALGRAPDISNMSPEERASRLYERVMMYDERGQRDSAALFATMALSAHELLDSLDVDLRYHVGRIAEAAGLPELALAHADTILRADANHLLGLILGARAARLAQDTPRARTFDAHLLRVVDAERARRLPEYGDHRAEIDIALAIARSQD